MKYYPGIIAGLPIVLSLAACAPTIQPPEPDSFKDQLSMLQKQVLSLQKLESETKVKLDESTAVIETLTIKLKDLEEKQKQAPVRVAVVQPQVESRPTPTPQAQVGKKPSPKKQHKAQKKVRRQE